MAKARKHHYIPRSYLNRFATNDELVVLDFINKKRFIASPQNIGHIRDFYYVDGEDVGNENMVESYFSKVENSAKSVITDYVNTMRLPKGRDWTNLVEFVASMYVRVPRFRYEYVEIAEGFLNMRAQHVLANPDSREYKDLAKHGMPEELLKDVSELQVTPHQNQYVLAMLKPIPKLVEVINQMSPTLIYSCGSSRFITSDNPIVLFDPKRDPYHGSGWVKDSIEVYFPLSPRTCLLLRWHSKNSILSFHDKQVAMVNSLLISSTTQYIFAKKEVTWISDDHKIRNNDAELFLKFDESKGKRNFLECGNMRVVPKKVDLNRIKKSRYDRLIRQKADRERA